MSRPLPRYREDTDPNKLDRIIADSTGNDTLDNLRHHHTRATAPGDTRRLRGIPVQAIGVGGTSPGTNPHQALEQKQRFKHHRINRA